MPPFVNTNCTNYSKPDRFDLAELRKENGLLVKGVIFRGEKKDDKEFEVTRQHCGGTRYRRTLDLEVPIKLEDPSSPRAISTGA